MLITAAAAVGHQREDLVLHGAGSNRPLVDRTEGIHIAIGHDQQFCAQARQRARGFRKLDVKADQQPDRQAIPLADLEAIAGVNTPSSEAHRCVLR